MELFIIIFFGLFGILIGSFLNVVILRYNTGKGVEGRSGCFSCGKSLKWYELIPVISYLFQKGKCNSCKSSISKQYIYVEIMTGILFSLIATHILFPLNELYSISTLFDLIISLMIVCFLIVIFVYDMRHKIIPDLFVYSFILLSLVRLIVFGNYMDIIAGPLIALPFLLLWFISKGKWMGFGDVKLALGIGWFLGVAGGISALCIAFWIGAIVALLLLLIQKIAKTKHGFSFKSEIPFAPFLILGLIIVYFFPMDLFYINTFFSLL